MKENTVVHHLKLNQFCVIKSVLSEGTVCLILLSCFDRSSLVLYGLIFHRIFCSGGR